MPASTTKPPTFTGLSAFPLTPMDENGIDEAAFARLVSRLASAGVDSIGALGSTGSYAYLTQAERARVARIAVEHAGNVPVIVGIGALRTKQVLALAADAQNAGAAGVLLAPVSYQSLTEDEVFGLYQDVTRELSVPLCVYDNPATTHFQFSDELHARIAHLPHVASIKIPPVPSDSDAARARVDGLRSGIPSSVTIGVSGDAAAVDGLNAGCDAWYSVLAGLLPKPCLAISRAFSRGDIEGAARQSALLEPVWALFRTHGSLRVVATMAEELGLTGSPNLPQPLRALDWAGRALVRDALQAIGVVDWS